MRGWSPHPVIAQTIPEQLVDCIAHGLFTRSLRVGRGFRLFKNTACITAYLLAEQKGGGCCVIRRPGIIQRHGGMKEVAGMHDGARLIFSDRLQQGFVPLPGDGMLAQGEKRET